MFSVPSPQSFEPRTKNYEPNLVARNDRPFFVIPSPKGEGISSL